ncbi:MAG: hypothetical protein GY732_07700 [Gammaproteobacteria bacterium]|nr:hypothetical protein [Gammaproteobacteria bacterium]
MVPAESFQHMQADGGCVELENATVGCLRIHRQADFITAIETALQYGIPLLLTALTMHSCCSRFRISYLDRRQGLVCFEKYWKLCQ